MTLHPRSLGGSHACCRVRPSAEHLEFTSSGYFVKVSSASGEGVFPPLNLLWEVMAWIWKNPLLQLPRAWRRSNLKGSMKLPSNWCAELWNLQRQGKFATHPAAHYLFLNSAKAGSISWDEGCTWQNTSFYISEASVEVKGKCSDLKKRATPSPFLHRFQVNFITCNVWTQPRLCNTKNINGQRWNHDFVSAYFGMDEQALTKKFGEPENRNASLVVTIEAVFASKVVEQ